MNLEVAYFLLLLSEIDLISFGFQASEEVFVQITTSHFLVLKYALYSPAHTHYNGSEI
jgi:hypothetical protein